jgi:hypothetical protein
MDDLTITDESNDSFTLVADGAEAVLTPTDVEVRIAEHDARSMVAWLIEQFDIGDGDTYQRLTITVPGAAGGAPREVAWTGDGPAPEWLERLASIALGSPSEVLYSNIVAGVSQLLQVADPDGERVPLATRVRMLINERDALRATPQADTTALAAYRRVLSTLGAADGTHAEILIKNLLEALGAGDARQAAEVAQTWRTWLDEAGRKLINAGVADSTMQGPIDPVKAINLLLNGHAAAIKKQAVYWGDRERAIAASTARETESAMAREREARAAVLTGLTAAEARHADALQRQNVLRDTLRRLRAEIVSNTNPEGATAPGVGQTQDWLTTIDRALHEVG